MTAGDRPGTREERLAARLRDNLRQRKQQARALDAPPPSTGTRDPDEQPIAPPLPKPPAPG